VWQHGLGLGWLLVAEVRPELRSPAKAGGGSGFPVARSLGSVMGRSKWASSKGSPSGAVLRSSGRFSFTSTAEVLKVK